MPNISRTSPDPDVSAPAGGGRRTRRVRGPARDNVERALVELRSCRSRLVTARGDAATAAVRLCGARAARADQLAEKLADSIAHCERLAFIVLGDLCAEK